MARYKKKDYLVVVELLEQVNKRLSQCDLHRVDAPAILSDCQEAAITLGTNLEQQGEEGIRLTNILEEYCENLYQFSQKLVEGADNKVCAGYIQTMAGQLAELEEGICKRLPERKEVVFLPYKASMWDSLESVWMAADKDPDCDAYVIPIPYYDKKPDGSFGEFHYEGDLYPDYVPITDYREYDLEERHPDMIFVHNPYDEFNTVTSVAPAFYSDKLKNSTDCLVYIPYFVLGENYNEQFSKTLGVANCDFVIVASEVARQATVKGLKRMLGNKRSCEEKVLALGSPKMDKAIQCKRENYPLPKEWAKCINGKKTVLYNTGVTGLINGNEKALEKIKDTLEIFREREDFALWWRPHPLGEISLASMRPWLREEYLSIIQQYKREKWGVFDDTSDLYRAVANTDIYYGDDSSLTYLYGVQGKPIIMQNSYVLMNSTNFKQDKTLTFIARILDETQLYYFPKDCNALCRMDLRNGENRFLGSIPGERTIEMYLCSNLIKYKDKIWVIPNQAHGLACFDLEKQCFEYMPESSKIATIHQVQQSILYEDNLYMISRDYSKIWIYSMLTGTVHLVYTHLEFDELPERPLNRANTDGQIIALNGVLYFLITDTNCLARYNIKSEKTDYISVGKNNQFMNLVLCKEKVWLLPYMEGNIACYDGKHVKELGDIALQIGEIKLPPIVSAVAINEYIYMLPYIGTYVMRLDVTKMELIRISYESENIHPSNASVVNDQNLLFTTSQGVMNTTLLIMDDKGTLLLEQKVQEPACFPRYSHDLMERIGNEYYFSLLDYRQWETRTINICSIMDRYDSTRYPAVAQQNRYRCFFSNADGTAGTNVWNHFK